MVLHISTPTHLVSAFPSQHFLVTVTHITVTEPLSAMVASAAGDFDWVSKVNVEMDNVESLSTGFAYQKVNERWTLTALSQPPVRKAG